MPSLRFALLLAFAPRIPTARACRGLADLGIAVDLVVNRRSPHYLHVLPDTACPVELSALAKRPLNGVLIQLRSKRQASLGLLPVEERH